MGKPKTPRPVSTSSPNSLLDGSSNKSSSSSTSNGHHQGPDVGSGDNACCFLCAGSPASVCPDCGLAAYCSEAHRQLHRPEKLCFPFKIEYRPQVGRFMVASRDIQPLGN